MGTDRSACLQISECVYYDSSSRCKCRGLGHHMKLLFLKGAMKIGEREQTWGFAGANLSKRNQYQMSGVGSIPAVVSLAVVAPLAAELGEKKTWERGQTNLSDVSVSQDTNSQARGSLYLESARGRDEQSAFLAEAIQ